MKPKSNKRGSKSASFEDNFTGTDEELALIIRNNAKYFAINQPADDDEAQQRITDMFLDCIENNGYPTVEKLAACLGITRQLLYDWEFNKSKGERRSVMIKDAKEKIAAMDAEAVVRGRLNTVAYIFRAKNYYGLTDNVTVEHRAAMPLGDSQDQSMLVGALLRQLQVQNTTQPDSATMPRTASDFGQTSFIDLPQESNSAPEHQATMPSDYQPEGQATMEQTSSDYATETERLSSDFPAEDQATFAQEPSDYETPKG